LQVLQAGYLPPATLGLSKALQPERLLGMREVVTRKQSMIGSININAQKLHELDFMAVPRDTYASSSTTSRLQISVNGGVSAGSFASCFNAAPGAACGAVSAVIVTAVDQMYEVSRRRFHRSRHQLCAGPH
jgi:hypothetical protein